VSSKNGFYPRQINYTQKPFLLLTKTMQILTALPVKLLKTVNVKVHQSNDNRKVSLEIAKVLQGSGEGWLFLLQAGARKQ